MRTEQEIKSRIKEILGEARTTDGRTIQMPTLQDAAFNRLAALYWALGQTNRQAADSANVALGGDPIDWS